MDRQALEAALARLDPKDLPTIKRVFDLFNETCQLVDQAPFLSREAFEKQLDEKHNEFKALLRELDADPAPIAPESKTIH